MNDLRDLRIRRLATAAAVTATLGLAGCGGGDDPVPTGGGDPSDRAELADRIPASAVAYAEGAVQPEGEAKAGVVDIARKLGGVQDPGGQLLRELNSGDVQYSRDIEPAIGDEVAGWAGKPSGDEAPAALVFEVEDKGKADQLAQRGDDFPQEKQSGGQTIRVDPSDGSAIWIGDEVGAVGTEEGVAATIAAQGGETLDKDERFTGPVGKLPDGEDLAVLWYDPAGAADLVDVLERQSGSAGAAGNPFGGFAGSGEALRQAVQREGSGPAAVTIQPRPGRVLIEGVETRTKAPSVNPAEAAKSVGAAPADSLAAIGLGDIGQTVGQQLQQGGAEQQIASQVRQATGLDLQDDLLAWMGTGAIFVRGSGITDIGGALVVQAKDPAKATTAIERLSSRLTAQGAQVSENSVSGADTSVAVNGLGPVPILAAIKGERFALGVNAQAVQQALDGGQPLSGSPAYGRAKEALGGLAPQVLVDGSKASSLIDNVSSLGGASSDPQAQKAIAGVKRVQLLTAGSALEGQDVRSRFVLTYR